VRKNNEVVGGITMRYGLFYLIVGIVIAAVLWVVVEGM
jgi:hypothetical protein